MSRDPLVHASSFKMSDGAEGDATYESMLHQLVRDLRDGTIMMHEAMQKIVEHISAQIPEGPQRDKLTEVLVRSLQEDPQLKEMLGRVIL